MNDAVNHPLHYGGEHNRYEAIKIIEAWSLNFCNGNALKYVIRAGKKGASASDAHEKGKQDLQKALWYLKRQHEGLTQGRPAAFVVTQHEPDDYTVQEVLLGCGLDHQLLDVIDAIYTQTNSFLHMNAVNALELYLRNY